MASPSNALVSYKEPKKEVVQYGSGRIVNQAFTSAGGLIGKTLNQVAIKHGWGPSEAIKRIFKILGDEDARERTLNQLYMLSCRGHSDKLSNLQKECNNLIKYTLPLESPGTQLTAFKGIVLLSTDYPHLRRIFGRFKSLKNATDKKTAALRLWERCGDSSDKEWIFFSQLAAACLSEGDVTDIVESTPPSELLLISDSSGGVIEQLLRVINTCSHYEIPCAMGVRYLGGILQLSGFWKQIDRIPHRYVAQKLFIATTRLVKDIGVGCEALTVPDEKVSDIEGIDILTYIVLTGVKWWVNPPDALETQYWTAEFKGLLGLVIINDAEKLLPRSRKRAVQEFEWLLEYKRGYTSGTQEGHIHQPEDYKSTEQDYIQEYDPTSRYSPPPATRPVASGNSPDDISHTPHQMDFAPIAGPLPYPTVATPLPASHILLPGRTIPSPVPYTWRRSNTSRSPSRREHIQQPEGFNEEQSASEISPTPPPNAPRTSNNLYPWTSRPIPAKLQMPSLLSAQSPNPRGGFFGVAACGGYHERAASASSLDLPIATDTSFANPHSSARLSMAGSYAGSESGRPPIALKP